MILVLYQFFIKWLHPFYEPPEKRRGFSRKSVVNTVFAIADGVP